MSDAIRKEYEEWMEGRSSLPTTFDAFRAGFLRGVNVHARREAAEKNDRRPLNDDEIRCIRAGNYMAAIKSVRSRLGFDLRTAKSWVDKYRGPYSP